MPAALVHTMELASDALWLWKIIVKPGGKVITIEPSADALSVCALKEVRRPQALAGWRILD
jgi:hypothetical protein